jgi:hypothetical protein
MPSTAVTRNITRTKSQISLGALIMHEERRRAQRYRLEAPVALQDGSTGMTRDISTEGIYFETERGHSIGDTVNLSVHLREASIQCEGRVVRLEQGEGKFGVAVDLTSYRFD